MELEDELIFLGTGTSCGTPQLDCVAGNRKGIQGFSKAFEGCYVCKKSKLGDPVNNKDNRLNPSIVLRCKDRASGENKHVLIDACKTLREAVLRWFEILEIPGIDAIVLIHSHSDAMLGIDDALKLRTKGTNKLPVFLSEQTFDRIYQGFNHLVIEKPLYLNDITPKVYSIENTMKHEEDFGKLEWNIISKPAVEESQTNSIFKAGNISIRPFPVYHGGTYINLGFIIGSSTEKLVYISDVSKIPQGSMELLKNIKIGYLIMDAIHPDVTHYSHQSIVDGVELAKKLRPKHTLFLGMNHKVSHDIVNKELAKHKKDGLSIQLAHDGLVIPLKNIIL